MIWTDAKWKYDHKRFEHQEGRCSCPSCRYRGEPNATRR